MLAGRSAASNGDVTALRAVLDRADRAGLPIADLTLHTPDLDDVFLALTGRRQEVPA
ncbi:hypothetical protein [Pseudonocardia sp. NPDC049154]|uniref:hypothetical protein n=1 Tax=Pseudonocardia sp. NPDC049154 TaxID=3155501 RepID=UPI0033D2FB9F